MHQALDTLKNAVEMSLIFIIMARFLQGLFCYNRLQIGPTPLNTLDIGSARGKYCTTKIAG